ncbi:unnamed protein product [Urochloa decumbens]|uniref:DUF1618 domain-containing protein n=1 Tax=Urochloa decumbens TaxID=240449 RepID=A0ABC9F3J6_9POAL
MAPGAGAVASGTVSSWIPPTLPDCEGYDGEVLLDMKCYIADLPNATAAMAATSTGLPLQVSFHAARPPLLSHFCVHCPGLDFPLSAPKVVATDAGLVLLRVPVNPTNHIATIRSCDYFLYRPRARQLFLLPNPQSDSIADSATALLSIGGGGGSFAVAAIGNWGPVFDRSGRTLLRWVFDLYLYRSSSSSSKSEGRWTTRRMSVKDFVRDAAIPLPDSVVRLYHQTGRAFTVGGARGTVAWVDLWRGILLIDVTTSHPRPVLRDVPLPVPARGNWGLLGEGRNPGYIRDVAISRRRDCIKYVEMEIEPSRVVRTLPDSYHEWVRGGSRRSHVIPGSWKATTWSMAAVPGRGGSSWTDWKIECEVESKDVAGGGGLLSKLSGRATLPEVPVAYPTLSADDDTVYLLSSTKRRGEMVVAVDLRNKTLRGAAKLDAQKTFCSMPTYCASDICRYLTKGTAGTREEHKRTEVRVRQRQQLMTSRPTR